MTNTPSTAITDLSDKDVLSYLKDNPDFLVRHPKILQSLTPPEVDQGRGIVDFQHFMLKKLKDDKQTAETRQRQVIDATRANMNIQARVHACVVRLLDARSFEEFIETISTEMGVILDVDIITLVIENTAAHIPHVQIAGVRIVDPGVIDHFLGGKDSHLEENCKAHDVIFGGGASLVKSQALMRLNISRAAPNGLIAFGSRAPNYFNDGQATDLIGFLADVVERQIRQWLDLP